MGFLLGSGAAFAEVSTAKYSLGAEVYGLGPYPLESRGYRAGYQFSESLEMELTYIRSTSRVLMIDIDYMEYGARLKHFVTPFVNWGVGLGERKIDLAYDVALAEEDMSEGIEETSRALSVSAHLGIEIDIFDSVVVGSDFVTVSKPIHWLENESQYPDNPSPDEEDPRGLPFVQKAYDLNIHILRTYIKVRF